MNLFLKITMKSMKLISKMGVMTAVLLLAGCYTVKHSTSDGRTYLITVPETISEQAPLVVVLHGYTSSARNIKGYSGFDKLAETHGFVAVYPQGTRDRSGNTHWNANLAISNVDDVAFITELVNEIVEEYQLNSNNVFVTGMSNGGFMSFTLSCNASTVFSAMASVTGTMSGADWNSCTPEQPLAIMQISGTADTVVPVDGSMTPQGGWGGAPHIDIVMEDLALNKNQCMSMEDYTLAEHTEVTSYSSCSNDKNVQLLKIGSWGHFWPTDTYNRGFAASDVIWDFFADQM